MGVMPSPVTCVDSLRCPRIEGLPAGVVTQLHQSIVRLVQLRRSLEITSLHLERSKEAVWQSRQLLEKIRKDGF
jgi:hypothetical protein